MILKEIKKVNNMQIYYPDLYHSKLLNTSKRDEIRLLLSEYEEVDKSF